MKRAILVVALLLPAPAWAAPKIDPTATATDDAAKARYAEGIKLYRKKKYEEARAAFLQALALKKRPETTFMLAEASLKAGRWLDAAHGFDEFTAEMNGEIPAKMSDLFESGRREAESHLGRLRFDVPSGAEVTVDNERVASLDTPLQVMPGQHTVVVTHRGEKKTETVDTSPGATTTVRPTFIPKAIVPAPEPRARPASTPSDTPAPEDSTPGILSPPATMWPIYVAGVAGLGGLTLAAIFGGLQANADHAVEVATQTITRAGYSVDACTSAKGFDKAPGDADLFTDTCITLQRGQSLSTSNGAVFVPSLVLGAAGAAIAIGWFLFAPKAGEQPSKGKEKSQAIVPWFDSRSGGATVLGSF